VPQGRGEASEIVAVGLAISTATISDACVILRVADSVRGSTKRP